MKYSINGTGNIVAERDIYSLGGFIPKGSVGAKVANEDQISQDGECWLASGDISSRPDVRVKDNAYIGTFTPRANPVHTDGITEFSGNTLIPGDISVRSLVADTKNNFFARDSFIGVSMDVLCGPSTTTTAFPFEQGDFKKEAAKGTLFASMKLEDVSACRSTAIARLGRNTYLYIPAGYRARVFWAYYDTSNRPAYSGESTAVAAGLTKLDHLVYKLAVVVVVKGDGTAMTPANLLATGAKILGHIDNSRPIDVRPESASGQYVMDNSSFVVNTNNFGLATNQLWYLAGGLYNTSVYTLANRAGNKVYGTFHNVQRLEYDRYLSDSYRTDVNRDRFISAYDCPLLRVDGDTYNDALAAKGDLVLRRCIVPKAEFRDDVINGNTYEDIDFSFANEDLGFTIAGYARFTSSHKQGIYRLSGGPTALGFVSHKGNLADTAILYQAENRIPLDGSILEQGYFGGGLNSYYESSKSDSPARVRTGKPLPTFGLTFPSLPAGYSVRSFYYLDDGFIIRSVVTDPTGLDTTYPYVVMVFRRDDDFAIDVNDFIALNRTLRIIDHTKAPEITGSAYVGAGVTVRGDVKLIGDPYVNRVLDVNAWEWGGIAEGQLINGWTTAKIISGGPTDADRRRLKELIPVEPGAKITCNSGYWVRCYFFDYEGNYISTPGWGQMANTAPANAAFAGMILKKGAAHTDSLYIEDSDILLANVKYLRAFKKRRYITNELDRTSPEDILLKPGDFGNFYAVRTLGGTYDSGKTPNANILSLHRPVNVPGIGTTINYAVGVMSSYGSLDALTRFISADIGLFPNTVLFGGGFGKNPAAATLPSEAPDARLVIEFTPSPRIVVPYGSSNLFISGPKIRMYDNAVLSRSLNQEGGIVLRGDAIGGYDFDSGSCMCSNGHSDAIIKLP